MVALVGEILGDASSRGHQVEPLFGQGCDSIRVNVPSRVIERERGAPPEARVAAEIRLVNGFRLDEIAPCR
jgi:hypothetical protein